MRLAPCAIMKAAPRARAQYLVRAYGDIIARPHLIAAAIERLRPFHSKETIESWRILVDARDFGALAEALMREHYDPLYDRSRKRRAGAPVLELSLAGLAPADIDMAARRVAAMSGPQRAVTANASTDCASG
jgi:tRNA 2-selenouridine synthase